MERLAHEVWGQLSMNQKKTLEAVMRTGGHQVLPNAVAQEFSIATSSLQRAL